MENTDEQILVEVIIGLNNNSRFDAKDIHVSVNNGIVFLFGFVDSWESRRSAVDIAENVSGVIKVHSKLELHPRKKP